MTIDAVDFMLDWTLYMVDPSICIYLIDFASYLSTTHIKSLTVLHVVTQGMKRSLTV